MTGSYGVRWVEADKSDHLVIKQRFFESAAQLSKSVERLEQRANFIRIDAWLGEGLI